jgi:hypothetical protein
MDTQRRSFLISSAAVATAPRTRQAKSQDSLTEAVEQKEFVKRANQEWLEAHHRELAAAKEAELRGEFSSLSPPQQLVPFKDWDFYYLKGSPSFWSPNPGQEYERVVVPVGFVTDLTSAPKWAWSSGIRPEGPYAYAAIIHDYLYWAQERSKEEADRIFLYAMEDSKVEEGLRKKIYRAVDKFGSRAWTKNAKLRASGERRVLRRFPDDFTIGWKEWKQQPGVFVD